MPSGGNPLLTYDGFTLRAKEWSEITGISVSTIVARKKYGWTNKRTLTTPVKEETILTANGKSMNMTAWARRIGMCRVTLLGRIRRGWSHERAINTPVEKGPRRRHLGKFARILS